MKKLVKYSTFNELKASSNGEKKAKTSVKKETEDFFKTLQKSKEDMKKNRKT